MMQSTRAMMDGCATCEASVKGAGPTESSYDLQKKLKISESSDTKVGNVKTSLNAKVGMLNTSKNHHEKNPMFRPFQKAADAPPIEKIENGGSKNNYKCTSNSVKPNRSEFGVPGPLEQPWDGACNPNLINAQSEGGTCNLILPHNVRPILYKAGRVQSLIEVRAEV